MSNPTRNMNNRIGEDDNAYFRAMRVVVNEAQNQWTIHVDPDDCLVARAEPEADIPTISDVQQSMPAVTETGTKTVYDGPVLFSGGVIVRINGKFVFIYRDAEARTSPQMWTSPAGRGDRDPGTTALKEFYEELAVVADGDPVFAELADRSAEFEQVYERTLETIGQYVDPKEWTRVEASTPRWAAERLTTVVTQYGDQQTEDQMLATYIPETNTVEVRFVVDVELPTKDRIDCYDAELRRHVERFDVDEVQQLFGKEKLVPPDRNILTQVLPDVS